MAPEAGTLSRVHPRFVARYAATGITPAGVAHVSRFLASQAAPPVAMVTASLTGRGVLRGAFEANPKAGAVYRRATGGRSVQLGDGCMYVALTCARPTDVVPDANGSNLLNRFLRPLLRALTAEGALAH